MRCAALALSVCLAVPLLGRVEKSQAPPFDPAVINDATPPPPNMRRGPAIFRAQILLSRAGFSPGEMDGAQGKNFSRALMGFQQSRNLPATGQLDDAAWKGLNEGAAPVIVTYTLTPEDVSGPFTRIPTDMMEQAKLPALGYSSLEEKLAEKFHISPLVLKSLNPQKKFEAGAQINVPDISRVPVGKAARVFVTASTSTVTAVDETGKVLRQYVASAGSEHDPLPIGEWKITGVFKNPTFNYNPALFWDANPGHSKAKIAAGPNNPVGLVWIDLSKEHYGIHGTPNPANVGHTQSHGCIRLPNWDALELADMVAKDTPVTMRER